MLPTLLTSDFFLDSGKLQVAQSFISFSHKVKEINREKVQLKVQFFSPNLIIRALMKTTYLLYYYIYKITQQDEFQSRQFRAIDIHKYSGESIFKLNYSKSPQRLHLSFFFTVGNI